MPYFLCFLLLRGPFFVIARASLFRHCELELFPFLVIARATVVARGNLAFASPLFPFVRFLGTRDCRVAQKCGLLAMTVGKPPHLGQRRLLRRFAPRNDGVGVSLRCPERTEESLPQLYREKSPFCLCQKGAVFSCYLPCCYKCPALFLNHFTSSSKFFPYRDGF